MKKEYLTPEFEFIGVRMETVMSDLKQSDPQIPVESGDPGEAD